MANIPKYMKSKYVIYLIDGSIVYAKDLNRNMSYIEVIDVVMINGDNKNEMKLAMIPYCRIKYIDIKAD